LYLQEIRANAHKTRDSSSLMPCADCVGLSPVISVKIPSINVRGSLKSRKKFTKTPILGVQGRSRSSMLIPPERSSAVLVMIRSKPVSTFSC